MKHLLVMLATLIPIVCSADSGDDTLSRWLDSSELVVEGTFTKQSITSVHEMIVHYHHFDFKVAKVIKGNSGILGEQLPVQIVRFERNEDDRNPLLQKGKKCILFLKRADAGNYPVWTSSDMWFSIQPSYPSLVSSLTRLQTTKTEQAGTGQPATASESKSEGSNKPQPEAEGRSR